MNIVRVGVGVAIFKESSVLLGLRVSPHGAGSWSFPGGHLEFGETPEECARRETLEETGLIISDLRRGPWVHNDFPENGRQYVTLIIAAKYQGGEVEVKEKDKCKVWQWFPLNHLPSPLFLPIQTLLDSGYSMDKLYSLFKIDLRRESLS